MRVLIERDFLKGLLEVFVEAEDFESIKDLHALCNIMKMLILYNETAIIERIVTDELILGVVGMLECEWKTAFQWAELIK